MADTELILTRAADDGVELVDPDTGECYELAVAPTDVVAVVLRNIEARIRELYEARRFLGEVMIERMDRGASWTHRARGVVVTAPSPKTDTDWDAELLSAILDELVEEGVITRDAQVAAVQPRTEYKPLKRGIAAILKIPGVEERVAVARRAANPRPRSVKVELNRGGE